MIDGHGRGRIGDFGFSWEVPQVVSGRSMFTAKAFARSEGYYPTELTHGQCGPRTDVYSLGVVRHLYLTMSLSLQLIRALVYALNFKVLSVMLLCSPGYPRNLHWAFGIFGG